MIPVQLQIKFTTLHYRDQGNVLLHMLHTGTLTILKGKTKSVTEATGGHQCITQMLEFYPCLFRNATHIYQVQPCIATHSHHHTHADTHTLTDLNVRDQGHQWSWHDQVQQRLLGLPCECLKQTQGIMVIIIAIISTMPHLTDKGEHTALYKSNSNVCIKTSIF